MRPALASALFSSAVFAVVLVAACGGGDEEPSGASGTQSTTSSSAAGTGGDLFPSAVATTGTGGASSSSSGTGAGGTGGAPTTCKGTATAGTHVWSETFTDPASGSKPANQTPLALALDASGNIGVVGAFMGSFGVGATTLTAVGSSATNAGFNNVFIAKLDPSGVAMWAKGFGNAQYPQSARAVSFDAAGNMIVAGTFRGTVGFGGTQFTSNTCCFFDDAFLAKYDGQGNHVWSKRFGDSNSETPRGLAVTPGGDIIMAGGYQTKLDFGGGVVITAAGAMTNDGFVAAFDGQGTAKWAKTLGDAAEQAVAAVAVDASGNIVVTGKTQGAVDFGNGPQMVSGTENVFVAKLSPTGAVLWGKLFGTDKASGEGVAVDASGNIYLTGTHQGTIDFGGKPLSNQYGDNVFVAKLDPQGNHVWSRSFGDDAAQFAYSIAVDKSGNLFVAGEFNGAIDFGTGALMTAGALDAFLVKLDNNGCAIWAKAFGAAERQLSRSVTVDAMGRPVVTGTIKGTVNFGGTPFTSQEDDIFLAKFAP